MTNINGIKGKIIFIGSCLVALLWFYAALSKIAAHGHYQDAMLKQPFPTAIRYLLIWTLPPFELLIGITLLTERFFRTGLYISAALFGIFAVYIALILIKAFGHIPCSCGGLIEHMGWKFHLGFNLAFLALNLYLIFIDQKRSYVTYKDKFNRSL